MESGFSSDADLVAKAKAGHPWAWNQIVRQHQGLVMALIQRARIQNDADDVFQDTFVRVYKYLSTFDGRSSLKTWIYRITSNAIFSHLDQVRSRATRFIREGDAPEHIEGPGLDDFPDVDAVEPGESLDRKRLLKALNTVLRGMPDRDRTILLLRDVEDFSYEEIASTLELPLGTVKSRLARARQHLITACREQGLVRNDA